jgi:hypothetical protein
MPRQPVFRFAETPFAGQAHQVLRRLPPVVGRTVRIERSEGLRDRRGPVHAGAFLHQRRIAFDCTIREFRRIFAHELFHFVWWRAGNPARRSYEQLLEAEGRHGAAGELGWSAEWRKEALSQADIIGRSRRWREYCCESFCDTAAWLFAAVGRHPEFTLDVRFRPARRAWFRAFLKLGRLRI